MKTRYYIEKRIHNEGYEIETGTLISNFIKIKDSESEKDDIQRIKLIAESYGSTTLLIYATDPSGKESKLIYTNKLLKPKTAHRMRSKVKANGVMQDIKSTNHNGRNRR